MRRRASLLCIGMAASVVTAFAAAPAVQWTRTYAGRGKAQGRCVQQTSDGGFIVAGGTWPHPERTETFYLVRADPQGNTVWERNFSGSGDIYAYSVQQTADGGYIVVGQQGEEPYSVWLIKTDTSGDLQWQAAPCSTSHPFSRGFSVVQTSDNGYAIAAADMGGDTALLLIRTDSLGVSEWLKRYPVRYSIGNEDPVQVRPTPDGGYVIATKELLKVDSLGNQQWLRSYSGLTAAHSVVRTPDGGYVVTGSAVGQVGNHRSRNQLFLLKTDAQGNSQWTTYLASTYWSEGNWVERTSDGGFIIGGMIQPVAANETFIVRTNSTGTMLWADTLKDGMASCIRQTGDGGFITTGIYDIPGDTTGSEYLFLRKYGPEK